MNTAPGNETEDESYWKECKFSLNAFGGISARDAPKQAWRRMDVTELSETERAFVHRVAEYRRKLHTELFRVYAYYHSPDRERIFLQIEFIQDADNKKLWDEIDSLTRSLGRTGWYEMDRGPNVDDETKEYVHIEVMWRIDEHTIGDALALRDRIYEAIKTADLWKQAGNAVF